MTLAFPHAETCPICSTSCDDVLALQKEVRVLRFLLVGALTVAAGGSRPAATLDQVRELAMEAFGAAAFASSTDLDLEALFPIQNQKEAP